MLLKQALFIIFLSVQLALVCFLPKGPDKELSPHHQSNISSITSSSLSLFFIGCSRFFFVQPKLKQLLEEEEDPNFSDLAPELSESSRTLCIESRSSRQSSQSRRQKQQTTFSLLLSESISTMYSILRSSQRISLYVHK